MDDARSQLLLSQSVKHTKALQQLAKEKEELHEALTQTTEELRLSELARADADARALRMERALQVVSRSVSTALNAE